MSLADLRNKIAFQEEAIRKASPGLKSTLNCTPWKDKPVKRDESSPIEDVVLPDDHIVATLPEILPKLGWAIKSKRILVRSEYNEAEQAAVSCSKTDLDAFMVSGQPGIGKSIFLLWLLMCRLALKLPTALQIDDSYAILFHKAGVFEFNHLMDHNDYDTLATLSKDPSNRIWALIDSNSNLLEPAKLFKYSPPFFIVDSVSPRSGHLEWLKKLSHEYFYMKSWSDSEVLQVRPFLNSNPTEYQLWHLHKTFGASPRDLIGFARIPIKYEDLLIREIETSDPRGLQGVVRNPELHNLSHHLFTVGPSQDSRGRLVKDFASKTVFGLLWDRYLKQRTAEMEYFYNLFTGSPGTSVSAGWLFEARMHQLLARENTIQMFHIHGHRAKKNLIYSDYTASLGRNNPRSLQWTSSDHYTLPKDHTVELQEGHYYRPDSTSFPTIDSLLLFRPPGGSPPILLMFQITRNKAEHDVNPRGLREINTLNFPSDAHRYYVVVTPEGVRPKITVPMEHFKGQQGSPDELFTVYHYPVYQLFTD